MTKKKRDWAETIDISVQRIEKTDIAIGKNNKHVQLIRKYYERRATAGFKYIKQTEQLNKYTKETKRQNEQYTCH